jgi:hypothetical protein
LRPATAASNILAYETRNSTFSISSSSRFLSRSTPALQGCRQSKHGIANCACRASCSFAGHLQQLSGILSCRLALLVAGIVRIDIVAKTLKKGWIVAKCHDPYPYEL